MSIASEIERLINAKVDIKLSIENKGVDVDDDATLDEYSDYIDDIQTGTTPTGTINITTNGTTDVTNYASANVNVQPTLQSKSVTITSNTTTNVAPDNGYDGLSSVAVTTNVSGGTTPTKGYVINSWDSNGNPTEITTYGYTTLPEYMFFNYSYSTVNFSKVEKFNLNDELTTIDGYCFGNCVSLKKISMLNVDSINSSSNKSSFRNCSALKKVWIGSYINNGGLGRYAFSYCSSIDTIYINLPRATVEAFTNYQYAFMNDASKTGIIVCNDDNDFISKADFDALVVS